MQLFDPHDLYTGEQFSKVLSTLTAVNKATEGKKKFVFFFFSVVFSNTASYACWGGFFGNSLFMMISGGLSNFAVSLVCLILNARINTSCFY